MWFLLALASALFQVLRNMVLKRLGHALDDTINAWGRVTLIVPFALVPVLWRGEVVLLPGFWYTVLLFGIAQTIASLALARALYVAEISLVTPLWKISLLLVVAWGFFVLGETPSSLGLLGILLSLIGVYLLNIQQSQISWFSPLLALFRERGQRWTVLAAIGYAFAVVWIKQAALLSDPFVAVLAGYIACSLIIFPYTLYRSARQFRHVPRYWKSFFMLGLLAALSTWCGTTAFTLSLSSYVEAVKQIEVLLALIIGGVVFREGERIRRIWPGALLTVVGLVLVQLGS